MHQTAAPKGRAHGPCEQRLAFLCESTPPRPRAETDSVVARGAGTQVVGAGAWVDASGVWPDLLAP